MLIRSAIFLLLSYQFAFCASLQHKSDTNTSTDNHNKQKQSQQQDRFLDIALHSSLYTYNKASFGNKGSALYNIGLNINAHINNKIELGFSYAKTPLQRINKKLFSQNYNTKEVSATYFEINLRRTLYRYHNLRLLGDIVGGVGHTRLYSFKHYYSIKSDKYTKIQTKQTEYYEFYLNAFGALFYYFNDNDYIYAKYSPYKKIITTQKPQLVHNIEFGGAYKFENNIFIGSCASFDISSTDLMAQSQSIKAFVGYRFFSNFY